MFLSDDDIVELNSLVSSRGVDAVVADRARAVLWRSEGYSTAWISGVFKVTVQTVRRWVRLYKNEGVDGLFDAPKTGRKRWIDASTRAHIVALTRQSPPDELGISHWSSRVMADYLARVEGVKVSHNFISELWKENGLQPHRVGTFKFSPDPDFAEKVVDIVGLYLDPPHGAVVLSVEEKVPDPSPGSNTTTSTHRLR